MTCPGSVALSEGIPDQSSAASLYGTYAHEILEKMIRARLAGKSFVSPPGVSYDMLRDVSNAADFLIKQFRANRYSEFMVETRIPLTFIHPEAFGTFDGAVLAHFDTLHVYDFKYGTHLVSPVDNLQMIFYALALAYRYHWNFKKVRLWIIQPRARSYDGPTFWELSIDELRAYVPKFKRAVRRVETKPKLYKEGAHCFFCKAKGKCPLKLKSRDEEAKLLFASE